ncbi:hypothetical protein IAU60_003167 [Kwoniella sp. DSM 27419]
MSAIAYQPDAANHDLDAKLDTKLEVEMLETRAPPDYAPEYLTWGLLPTARKFWRAEIICVLAAFGAVFDGYAVSEIVAKDWKVYSAAKFLAASPTRIRGALLSMYSLAFGIGQLAASVGLQVIATHDNFRQIFYAEFVFVGLFLPALLIAPESHGSGCRVMADSQFVGLSLFFSYTTYFFQLAGYPKPFEASLIQSCILLASLVGSFFVMDRVGRRYLLLGGGAIMTCCSFSVAGIAFKSVLPGAALVSLACIWTSAYALSVGCTGWAYVADTATARLRAKTTGLAAAGTCIFGLIFQYTTPLMLSPQKANWGLKIGFFYGGLSVLGWFIVFFLVPEMRFTVVTALALAAASSAQTLPSSIFGLPSQPYTNASYGGFLGAAPIPIEGGGYNSTNGTFCVTSVLTQLSAYFGNDLSYSFIANAVTGGNSTAVDLAKNVNPNVLCNECLFAAYEVVTLPFPQIGDFDISPYYSRIGLGQPVPAGTTPNVLLNSTCAYKNLTVERGKSTPRRAELTTDGVLPAGISESIVNSTYPFTLTPGPAA